MSDLIQWIAEPPPLQQPLMLMALDGFIDAGSAAATAAMFLRHRWRSDVVARFDRDAFLDYRARRPTVVVDNGVLRRVRFDETEVLVGTTGGPRDAAFLLGPEPDMRWEAFSAAVVDVCRRLEVAQVVGLGAYPAAAPHTRPTNVVMARNLATPEFGEDAHTVPGYTGPVGAQTVLQHRLGEAGIGCIGLWAEVPHYISASNHPNSALALVAAAAAIFEVDVDTAELAAAAKLHDEQVDEAVAEHPDASEMIAALEQHVRDGGSTQQVPSGDDLAAEIESFLRERPN